MTVKTKRKTSKVRTRSSRAQTLLGRADHVRKGKKALAAKKASASKRAFADQKALADQKAAVDRKNAAGEKALADQRVLADKETAAYEKALADQKVLADETALAVQSALADQKALADQEAAAVVARSKTAPFAAAARLTASYMGLPIRLAACRSPFDLWREQMRIAHEGLTLVQSAFLLPRFTPSA